MYEHISSNKLKSFILILFFVFFLWAFLALLAFAFSRLYELDSSLFSYFVLLSLAICILAAVGSYYNSDKIVLAMSCARPVSRDEHPGLYYAVEGLSIAAGVPMPKIYLIDDAAPNAFTTGRNPRNSVVVFTTGLLQKLNEQELKGVIGHELAHIRNYDVLLGTVAVVMVGLVTLLSDWFLRSFWWSGGRKRRSSREDSSGPAALLLLVAAILMAIAAPTIAMIIRLAISRRREFLADADGALITRYPPGLASALRKISQDREPLEVANKVTAHLYIANPLKDHNSFMDRLFSTHPPIEERIKRLEEMSLGIRA